MNGTDENPDAPRDVFNKPTVTATAPAPTRPTGYPIEEALRPITLPANMSEVSIGPHAQVSPYAGADALRARYGITSPGPARPDLRARRRLSTTRDDGPSTASGSTPARPSASTSPCCCRTGSRSASACRSTSIPSRSASQLGAPMKFTFGDKFAIGGLDDLLNIQLSKFAPSFYQEAYNAAGAAGTCDDCNHTEQSRGHLRFSAYGIYQPHAEARASSAASASTSTSAPRAAARPAPAATSRPQRSSAAASTTRRAGTSTSAARSASTTSRTAARSRPAGYLALRI